MRLQLLALDVEIILGWKIKIKLSFEVENYFFYEIIFIIFLLLSDECGTA